MVEQFGTQCGESWSFWGNWELTAWSTAFVLTRILYFRLQRDSDLTFKHERQIRNLISNVCHEENSFVVYKMASKYVTQTRHILKHSRWKQKRPTSRVMMLRSAGGRSRRQCWHIQQCDMIKLKLSVKWVLWHKRSLGFKFLKRRVDGELPVMQSRRCCES